MSADISVERLEKPILFNYQGDGLGRSLLNQTTRKLTTKITTNSHVGLWGSQPSSSFPLEIYTSEVSGCYTILIKSTNFNGRYSFM